MINPIHSNLYKLTSKKYLLSLLHIHNRQFLKQSYVSKQISPYIQTDPKPRLIEVPSEELKTIQRHIKNELNKIIESSKTFNDRDDGEIYLLENAFPGYEIITTDKNVFLIKNNKILMMV